MRLKTLLILGCLMVSLTLSLSLKATSSKVGTPDTVSSVTPTFEIQDRKGRPISDAVVYLMADKPLSAISSQTYTIDQIEKQFRPFVSAVPVGAEVNFPNNDDVRHHVYSFSQAKTFELKLYDGKQGDAVVMDKPGVVVLGCNIHDWMVSYLYVVDTPYFGVSDVEGKVELMDVSKGGYTLHVWHPGVKGGKDFTQRWSSDQGSQAVKLKLRSAFLWKPKSAKEDDEY